MNNTTDYTLNYTLDYTLHYTLDDFSETVFDFILLAIFLLAMVKTLVTNTVTVVVMVTTPKLRTRTNAFIVSLAFSDVLFAVYYTINMAKFICMNGGFFGPFVFWEAADWAWSFQVLGCYGNLFLVSSERWLYIAKPFWYQCYVTKRAVVGSITTTWIITLGGMLPFLTMYKYTWVLHTTLFFVLLSIYTHMCLITLKHLKKLPNASHGSLYGTWRNVDRPKVNKTLSLYAENMKSIKQMISICGSFFHLGKPIRLLQGAYTHLPSRRADLVYVLHFTFSTLSLFKFFVYALAIPLFRKTLKKRFRRSRCCRGSQSVHVGAPQMDLLRK